MKVQNKVIVVTGGGSGMGRELVLNLLSKNAKVIAIDINQNDLQETVELAGTNKGRLSIFVVDITSKAALKHCFNKQLHNLVLLMASSTTPVSYNLSLRLTSSVTMP
ncbi:hypothetical protein BH10BAC2_BH10BAC2_14390 [soil metagenome]